MDLGEIQHLSRDSAGVRQEKGKNKGICSLGEIQPLSYRYLVYNHEIFFLHKMFFFFLKYSIYGNRRRFHKINSVSWNLKQILSTRRMGWVDE